ncbi:MAG: hypothetical protein IPN71_09840 [Fibrobacteres bacterium]|nr:hypothetical protein [Fibrobacterota bacterium]
MSWNKYFQSVGRNATWLLNLPPDNRGLIHKTDSIRVDSLNGWINGTFPPIWRRCHGDHQSWPGWDTSRPILSTPRKPPYATPDNMSTDTIVFDLGSPKNSSMS